MAVLSFGYYLCEACKHFDTDGNDGNHPFCNRQLGMNHGEGAVAVKLGEYCPYGYEFGVPSGYPASVKRNEKRAYMIREMIEQAGEESGDDGLQCAEAMVACADNLCDQSKTQLQKLLNCLENDYGITASWDGLRKAWVMEGAFTCPVCGREVER